jgi:hypothetical protein
MKTQWRESMLALSLAILGCDAGDDDGDADPDTGTTSDAVDSTGAPGFDESQALARAMAYETELVQINAMPRASQHGLADTVDVWVAPEIAELYRSLDPDADGPLVELPDDALLVKTHLDGTGVVAGYTVMTKGDPASTSGGWWWARVDANGNPAETGQVGFCIGCHQAVEAEGWAFGVALDNRR